MATISDVAHMAGVSKSTVSNVFSRKRPISKEVSERVLEAARQLHYKPNHWARSLAGMKTRIIGLNMPAEKLKFSNFHLSLLNGVLKECYERGYRLLVNTLSSEFSSRPEHQSSDPVDGHILLDPSASDPRIEEKLRLNIPLVVIGRPSREYESRISYVDNDNAGMAELVTGHLLRLGHRYILFLNAPQHMTVSQDREAGYRRALDKAGVLCSAKLLQYKEAQQPSNQYGYHQLKLQMAANPAITAVIADTDKVALGVYQAAAEMKKNIPNDISVFAFSHDSIFAPEFIPPLTGVRLNGETLGGEAAKLLIDACSESAQRVAKRVLIPAELVFRSSCGSARTIYSNYKEEP